MIKYSILGSFTTKLAGWVPLGNNKDQNGADGHFGAIRVPEALHMLACFSSWSIKNTGGITNCIFSAPIACEGVIASEPGHQ